MFLVPRSPRRRRQLVWVVAAALVGASAALTIVLLPNAHPARETFSNEPAQLADSGQTRLTPADRRQVDSTLDRFILAALDRRDPATAWALAGPDLRGTSTVGDWKAGQLPIPVYRAKGTTFHGWTQVYVTTNSVSFNVLVQPRAGTKLGARAFSVQMIRRGRGWAVNRLYPIATFTPVGEKAGVVGPNDFGAPGQADAGASHGRLGAAWIALPVGLFVVGLLAVGLVLSRNWLRFRRARRAFGTTHASTMPSLPSSRSGPSSTGSAD